MNTQFRRHLFERQIRITYRHVWLDDKNEILTFPLWNLSGQLVGYQQYNWKATKDKRNKADGKYWTYTTDKSLGVFGLDLIDWSQPIYVVEGIWDAITVQNTGRNCLAVMTNNPKHLWSWMRTLPVPIIAICEGDRAGKKLAKTGNFSVELPEGCDANELGLFKMNEILYEFEQNL